MQFLCQHEKHHETIEVLLQLCRPTFTCTICSKLNCLNLGIYNSHVRITTNADSRLQTDSPDRTLYKTSQLSPVSSYVPRESRPAGYQVEFVRYQSVFNFQCRFLLARSTEILQLLLTMHINYNADNKGGVSLGNCMHDRSRFVWLRIAHAHKFRNTTCAVPFYFSCAHRNSKVGRGWRNLVKFEEEKASITLSYLSLRSCGRYFVIEVFAKGFHLLQDVNSEEE